MDVFCFNGNCPICSSKVIISLSTDSTTKFCQNGCYLLVESDVDSQEKICSFEIFDERFHYPILHTTDIKNIELNLVSEKIMYWKENDRYLTKIMGVE